MIIMHNLELDTRIDQRRKSLEKIRSKTILMDNQIILDFRVNSSHSLWRTTLNTLSVICSVKNVNPRKKPHPNRLTLSNARASHVSTLGLVLGRTERTEFCGHAGMADLTRPRIFENSSQHFLCDRKKFIFQ